jgi:hypothetical protein
MRGWTSGACRTRVTQKVGGGHGAKTYVADAHFFCASHLWMFHSILGALAAYHLAAHATMVLAHLDGEIAVANHATWRFTIRDPLDVGLHVQIQFVWGIFELLGQYWRKRNILHA